MSLLRRLFSRDFRLASDIEKKKNTITHSLSRELKEFLMASAKVSLDEFDESLKTFSKSESEEHLTRRDASGT
jgi:hypothetical protein